MTFLRNHREAIAAMDFFTVPTLTFGVLYCFFVIGHDRRQVLHHNVTRNPNALWVTLQLHEPWECSEEPQRFLVFDRDAKFSADIASTVKAMGTQPVRTRVVNKFIFASKEGEFPRPKAHARFPLIVVPRRNPVVL